MILKEVKGPTLKSILASAVTKPAKSQTAEQAAGEGTHFRRPHLLSQQPEEVTLARERLCTQAPGNRQVT